jgi:hypothetical protein
MKRLLALLMICMFTVMTAGPVLAAMAVHDEHDSPAAHHEDGAPCPDGDDHGPCDQDCNCLCCPGHASALYTLGSSSSMSPLHVTPYRFLPGDTFVPDGVFTRIFRPPRV